MVVIGTQYSFNFVYYMVLQFFLCSWNSYCLLKVLNIIDSTSE